MKTKNFTTTLPHNILRDLDIVSKETKKSKNDILSEAFLKWNKERKQKWVYESYKKAKDDKEWQSMAEEGMDEWLKLIQEWEK
ncbi:MAG TPA: hypothetical protein VEC13_03130 [Candidatus Paceibacterota bacterium]|nr:hypothetical protein [Candidatus Paceibacterota bacterium]